MVTDNAPFTYGDYAALLRQLRDRGYSFARFTEAKELIERRALFALLRHDIDFDLEKALRLAEIEARFGIAATYFFLVRTHHYNVFSREGSEIVARILELQHELGLHFDCAAYPEDGESAKNLRHACAREAGMLEDWFERPVSVVSYHRPNRRVLSGEPLLSAPRLHTYMPLFTEKICYRSDSRGQWKYGDPRQSAAFERGDSLHILVHPIWWNDTPIAARRALDRFVHRSSRALKRSIAQNCDIYRASSSPSLPDDHGTSHEEYRQESVSGRL